MSLPLSNSGIKTADDGSRYVGGSLRADGSVRKTIKIRPGFVPQEDVPLFRTRAQREREAVKQNNSKENNSSSISEPEYHTNIGNNNNTPSTARPLKSPHLKAINSILSGNRTRLPTGAEPQRKGQTYTGGSSENFKGAEPILTATEPSNKDRDSDNQDGLSLDMKRLSLTTSNSTTKVSNKANSSMAFPNESSNSVSSFVCKDNIETNREANDDKSAGILKNINRELSSTVSKGKYIPPSKRASGNKI
ncbi:hypothetical protein NADFUDRAFT_41237 [Nadsonia fulvescens var. elongata DSM 6958]|uniref:WIBG Mago-binding domain-containing protein n=1 Tax=Nadsonia fulvescens var. elongata DSM 6958 TaxID=857566 RepID=A0A1E3PME3_9ASCO|nr:hypothetical protein NADFUDRAFT_41237 [Nadsonia fulvescens var. elongata DSM 6958]